MNKKIVAIMGSYRKGGITEQAVEAAVESARKLGAEVSVIKLLEKHIEFCTNCRACNQKSGEARGICPLKDDMNEILDEMDLADGFILAAPVNCFNITAISRRFFERLVCYAYWPWGMKIPKMRLKTKNKKAVLITSTAMPAFFGRFLTGGMKALKVMADTLSAQVVGSLFIGLVSMEEKPKLTEKEKKKAEKLAGRLLK